jgi:hypothetical protein
VLTDSVLDQSGRAIVLIVAAGVSLIAARSGIAEGPLPGIAPDRHHQVPFRPKSVFIDDKTLVLFDGTTIASRPIDKTEEKFAVARLGSPEPGSSLAVRGGRAYLADRKESKVVVFDLEGKLLKNIPVEGPPSRIAVDDLRRLYTFSVLALRDEPDALVAVYDSSGTRTRAVGSLPASGSDTTRMQQRGEEMPRLVTDAHGDVWAILRSGKAAMQLGATRTGGREIDLSAVVPAVASADALSPEEEKKRQEKVRAKLVESARSHGLDPDKESVKVVVPRQIPSPFLDVACGLEECLGVGALAPRPGKKGITRISVVSFGVRKAAEVHEVALSDAPDVLSWIAWDGRSYRLFGLRGNDLLEYEITTDLLLAGENQK